MLDSNCALIDNDFLNHAIETKLDEESKCALLNSIFDAIKKDAVIHPWISDYEVMWDNKTINNIISKIKIKKATWDDVHGNQIAQKTYYEILFKELFKKTNSLPIAIHDVFTYCVKKQSLGELHNITACMICGCNLILSDDKDTKRFKRIISQTLTCDFEVYTRAELAETIRGLEGAPSRSELKKFAHQAN